jgi:biopolymer transport protein ExbD
MNFKNRQTEELEVNVTPLIDVVFLLLIFFMITTTFQKETELQINLPEASADESQDKDRPLEIVVDARGRFFVDGKELLNSSPDTLRAAVQKVTVGNKDRHVVIRGDGQADYQAVVTIMDVIGKLGLVKMSLSTSETAGK